MKCCRPDQLSAYRTPWSSSTVPLILIPPQIKGAQTYIFFWWKVCPTGVPPSPHFHHHNPQPILGTISSLAVYPSQGCSPPCTSPPFCIFWHQNFGAKIGKCSISLSPEEALLVLTSWKLVWIYYHYFQLCFAMWITYIINQTNEKYTL